MSRREPTRWEKDRGIFLKLGFVLSLSMVILAFNYSVEPEVYITESEVIYDHQVIEIIRTADPKLKTPPPPVPINNLILEPVPAPVDPIGPIDISDPVPIGLPGLDPNPLKPDPPRQEPPIIVPDDNIPLLVVEVMPRFPGCEDQDMKRSEKEACATLELLKFMGSAIDYPAAAREVGISGMVVVQFIVEKDGSITNAKVVRDIGGGCGREALRVVKQMPRWIPGMQQGRAVRVQFSLPVRFELSK
ncbi:MAG: TonB family protein [Saprospiraceae bacterium]|nr:TonB family protein [Saprospiraceae bacterium]